MTKINKKKYCKKRYPFFLYEENISLLCPYVSFLNNEIKTKDMYELAWSFIRVYFGYAVHDRSGENKYRLR